MLLRGEVGVFDDSAEGDLLRELRVAGDLDYLALLSWMEKEAAADDTPRTTSMTRTRTTSEITAW